MSIFFLLLLDQGFQVANSLLKGFYFDILLDLANGFLHKIFRQCEILGSSLRLEIFFLDSLLNWCRKDFCNPTNRLVQGNRIYKLKALINQEHDVRQIVCHGLLGDLESIEKNLVKLRNFFERLVSSLDLIKLSLYSEFFLSPLLLDPSAFDCLLFLPSNFFLLFNLLSQNSLLF